MRLGRHPDRARSARACAALVIVRWCFVALVPAPALLYGGGLADLTGVVAILGVVAVAANVYLVYLLFKVAKKPAATRQARRSG